MNKRIIVEYLNENKHFNNKILNEINEECLICMCKMKKNKIMITNNYCKCFNSVILCELCFIKWFKMNNRCLVCRNLFYNPQIQNKLINYKIDNILLKNKLKKKNFNSRIININNIENQQNEIVIEENHNNEDVADDDHTINENTMSQNSVITSTHTFIIILTAFLPTIIIVILNIE
tara:strand:- start:68 stop:598 length:531 start_codon:yes stop_codon:yes gene_type:complete